MSDRVPTSSHRRALVKLGVLVVFVAAAVLVGIFVPLPTLDRIRALAAASGWAGAAAFSILYGLATLTPLPKSVASIAAGVIWGLGAGFALVYTGAIIGAGLSFALGRILGREAVERFTGARIARVDDLLMRRGLASIIGVRLIPVIPFTVINYTASLTAVSGRDYALGTALGIIPGTLAFVAIGAYGFAPGPALYIALGALGALTIGGAIVGVRMRRGAQHPTPPQHDA